MRNYTAMRDVLAVIATSAKPLEFEDFMVVHQRDRVVEELKRLDREMLIESTIQFESQICTGGAVAGLTDEGEAFYRLIENDGVWGIILETLRSAGVDVSYPLLKEVCEEIVKRYVTSFIPDMPIRK